MKTNKLIILKDGRSLGFAEYGFAEGFPILFFHGLPGSRLEAQKLHQASLQLKIRLIGIDRPGMGLSSPQKNRKLLDWPEDIKEFANQLNLTTFSIIGHSGGAPYVAACAYRIPEKLHKAVIVSGMAPFSYPEAFTSLGKPQKFMYWMTRYCPLILKLMMRLSSKALDNPKQLNAMLKQLPEVDAKIFKNPHYKEAIIQAIKEAFRQNDSGVVRDFKVLISSWGFKLEEIQCPLDIWQGGQDQQAPVKHAEIYKQYVPQAKYVFLEEEGHLSILYNYAEQILGSAKK